jgi:hypothetical protein
MRGAVAIAVGALMLSGCASQPQVAPAPRLAERIVLLPGDPGRASAVVVNSGETEILLDTPYATAERRGTQVEAGTLSAEEVRRRYAGLLAAQPHKPEPYTMYFVLGSDEQTAA